MSIVEITGANGFIGSHVVREFCNNGIKVKCLVRKNSNLENLKGLDVELIYGDIESKESLVEAFKNVDFVIHIAAYARDWGSYKTFYDTNVTGTLNVLNACVQNGIKNIVYTGSISVYGEENSKTVKNEDSPFNPEYPYFVNKIFPCKMNYYRVTKMLGTKEALEFAKQNGLNLTVLEPAWVYGEREFNTGFYEYVKSAKSGVFVSPGTKKNKFHVIYAGDLAKAFFLAFKKQLQGINRIIIGNQRADYMERIYYLFCKEANIKKPANVVKYIVYPIGFVLELIYTLFNSRKAPLLTRGRVNMFYDNIEFSTRKAETLLDFKSSCTLEEGIHNTIKWYTENKYL